MHIITFVVPLRRALGHLLHHLFGQRAHTVFFRQSCSGKFQTAQRFAHIAAAGRSQQFQRALLGQDGNAILFPQTVQRISQPLLNILRRKRFKLKHSAA